MKKAKSYRELNKDLEEILYKLENELDDIDKAVELYQKGQKILEKIDEYLAETKTRIKEAKDQKQG